jgi:hypothetical protein
MGNVCQQMGAEHVSLECPRCGTRLKWREDLVAKKVGCPRCRHVFVLAAPAKSATFSEEARTVPGSCQHRWKHTAAAWDDATYTTNWPKCGTCGTSIRDFIDGKDIDRAPRQARSILGRRHQRLMSELISSPEAAWPAWGPCKLDPTTPLERIGMPSEEEPMLLFATRLRPVAWPFARMAGWHLYLQGGVKAMRSCLSESTAEVLPDGRRAATVSTIEALWHEIGGWGLGRSKHDLWLM